MLGFIAAAIFAASTSVALPSAAQSGGGGTGGSGTGGGGTGGSGMGGSGMGGAGGSSMTGAGGSIDDPGAQCTFAPHDECPERCPMYATCYVAGRAGQEARLYYRVDEQRFDCDGLDCNAAAPQLGDYCCERGEFAPSDDDGGCALPGAGPAEDSDGAPWLSVSFGLCAAGLGLYRRRRARARQ